MYKDYDPFTNYSGRQFCHLLAVCPKDVDNHGKILTYDCTCTRCGKQHVIVYGDRLYSYGIRSCGCTQFDDLTGGVFGKWKVISRTFSTLKDKYKRSWECECMCDKHTRKYVYAESLLYGSSTSCGCVKSPSIIGKRFGELTVLREIDERASRGGRQFQCLCEKCGNTVIVARNNLLSGHTTSCGRCSRMRDLTGQRFGSLTALYVTDRISGSSRVWHCRCDCGNEVDVSSNALVKGHTQHCSIRCTCRKKYDTEDKLRLAHILSGMMQRCYNVDSRAYSLYGARGIYVCDEWRNDCLEFINWALNHGYKQGLSIDRIDVNGPYAPWNCRWVGMDIQSLNRRSCASIKVDDDNKSVTGWAKYLGLSTVDTDRLRNIHRDFGEDVAALWIRFKRNSGNDKKYLMNLFGINLEDK